jgi:hypothetical protein
MSLAEKINAYGNCVKKSFEENCDFGRSRSKWKDHFEMYVKEMGGENSSGFVTGLGSVQMTGIGVGNAENWLVS